MPEKLPFSTRRDSDKGIEELIGNAGTRPEAQRFTTADDCEIGSTNTVDGRQPFVAPRFADQGNMVIADKD